MKDLITKHTKIERKAVMFNSPTGYFIRERESNRIVCDINIQKGAVADAGMVNGIFIEDLLLICIDQLEHFQATEFSCEENERALNSLKLALDTTRSRQYERTLRGVQGRNER